MHVCTCAQWNLSNQDTLETEESVLMSEASWLHCTHTLPQAFGTEKTVLFIEVSPNFQIIGFHCIHLHI